MPEPTRSHWKRTRPPVAVTRDEAEKIIGLPIVRLELAQGGLSNTHYRIELEGGEFRCLRIGEHGEERAKLERAVQASLRHSIPLPETHDFGISRDRPWTLYEWVAGERLETTFPRLHEGARKELGRDIGRILAAVHARRFSQTGILDANLSVEQSFDTSHQGLLHFARSVLDQKTGRQRLGQEIAEKLLRAIELRAQGLDRVSGNARLGHGDFGASNILVDPERNRVTAVLDWEFACAAPPYGDLGNLLRPPLGDDAEFCAAVGQGYRERDPSLAVDWLALARLSDLSAWLEFLGRPELDDGVLASARKQIARFIE